MAAAKKAILDCDPGHDDALAIVLACAAEEIELLGITTVAGNQTVDKTTHNALRILTLIGAEVPVARGAERPLISPLVTAPEIHGESGLDGAELPDPAFGPLPEHAVEFLVRTIREAPEPVILVPTGPLTNVALALRLAPDIAGRIERIILMGGAARESNATPAAEFNIYADPEAAHIVFTSGIPITMVGLDVTHRALFTPEEIARLSQGGPVRRTFAGLLAFYAAASERYMGIRGAVLHDPLAVAAAIDPGILATEPLHVEVELCGTHTRGATVVDLYRVTGRPPNAEVALDLNLPRFKELLWRALERVDRPG
ncbi:nucleoside hydrolase [Candidatus Bipolaricaulota sp. J31]